MISSNCIERIRNSVDIYDLVSPYVTLKKCGANWRGLSPFNHEKTPSFFVMPAKKIFRCFSSGYAGDIFRFIQLKENVSFVDAVEIIAKRFGIPVEYDKSSHFEKKPYSKNTLYEIHELVCKLFIKNFHADDIIGRKIRQYWTEERKFPLDVALENNIGFARNDAKKIIQTLLDSKFSIESLKASGLFFFKDGESDPFKFGLRFASRLTIPIYDIQGRIVGFSARFINGLTPKSELSDAKYINSPETDIFHKGNLLFGLHRARQYIDEAGEFWLVEGQFDTLRCWMNGLNTAIAPLGTAITDAQLAILRRYTTNVNCLLDGDSAGVKAAGRIIPMAMRAGLDLKLFILPGNNDPDSYFCNDFAKKFEQLKKSSMSSIQFLAQKFSQKNMPAMEKAEVLTEIFETISSANSSIAQESYVAELARDANFDQHALFQDFKKFLDRKKFTDTPPVNPRNVTDIHKDKLSTAEGQLLAIALTDDNIARQLAKLIDHQFWQTLQSMEGKVLIKILSDVHEKMWNGLNDLDNSDEFSDEEKNLIYSAMVDFEDDFDKISVANMCLKKIFTIFVKNEIAKIDVDIKKISLDETSTLRNLQSTRLKLRESLKNPPKIA